MGADCMSLSRRGGIDRRQFPGLPRRSVIRNVLAAAPFDVQPALGRMLAHLGQQPCVKRLPGLEVEVAELYAVRPVRLRPVQQRQRSEPQRPHTVAVQANA